MNKPKILYITTQGHWGGAQKYVFDLATSLTGDFDISVAVGEPNNNPDLQKKLKDRGVNTIQLKYLRRAISPIHDLLAIFEIRQLYKKIRPDIIHLNSSKAGILGSISTYNLKPTTYKLIYTIHGWVFNEPMNNLKKNLYIFLEKWTARKKDKIIVLSEDEKNIGVNKLKIKENKFAIIPVGINPDTDILYRSAAVKSINSILKKDILNENDFIFGTIANFYPTKNLSGLIEAFHIAKGELKNFHAVIIGDGEEKDRLKFLIKKYNLENNIHLTGFIENAQKLLKAFNVFVLPSKKEGLPYTILEAKINNVPIIATDVGAVKDIVANKKTGLLVPSENVEKLSEAILYAYQNQDKMKQMAETGYEENVNPYLKQNMAEQIIIVYKLLLRPLL